MTRARKSTATPTGQPRHTAFAILDFRFSDSDRRELKRAGVAEKVIVAMESELSDAKAFWATSPPSPRAQRARFEEFEKILDQCINVIASTDDLSLGVVQGYALPRVRMNVREFSEVLCNYREAARRAASCEIPERGADATRDTCIALGLARVLQEFNVALDAKIKGPFVAAVGIAFRALGIHKAAPENDAKRALKVLISQANKFHIKSRDN
jgi:hypothetical protein